MKRRRLVREVAGSGRCFIGHLNVLRPGSIADWIEFPSPAMKIPLRRLLPFLILPLSFQTTNLRAAEPDHDLVIYGGTCAAVTAAVQAKKMGKSVIIVSPDKHLGGLS